VENEERQDNLSSVRVDRGGLGAERRAGLLDGDEKEELGSEKKSGGDLLPQGKQGKRSFGQVSS